MAAQGIPVGVQLEECQKFVARCEKRIAAMDVERSRELERLEEGKSNLERFRQIVVSQQVVPLQILHQRWSNCEGKWPICSCNWGKVGMYHHARSVRPWFPKNGQFDVGGFRAHVRFRDRPMDARPSSRFPRCQPHGKCERSHEVVPRDSRDSIRHGPDSDSDAPVMSTAVCWMH